MKHIAITLTVLLAFLLAGCSDVSQPTPTANQPEANPPANLSRTDEQGAVVVVVEPLNLESADQTLDFEVSMETHSVDLSMDLAGLATLTTNTGMSASALAWDAPRGGHHVAGRLSFPASINGIPLLEGAGELTLTLRDVDASERIFTWELPR